MSVTHIAPEAGKLGFLSLVRLCQTLVLYADAGRMPTRLLRRLGVSE